jgi:hypothetical protein
MRKINMDVLSFVVLVLSCLFGYAAGAVTKAGRSVELRPRILDLALVLAIWAGAVYSRLAIDWNQWLLVIAWLGFSFTLGFLITWPRVFREEDAPRKMKGGRLTGGGLKRVWQSWSRFSALIGGFQSRLVLSLFFFTVFFPFAVATRLLSDPLGLKSRGKATYWLERKPVEVDLEQSRRQF